MDARVAIPDDIESVLYTEEQIQAHVAEVGRQISRDYAGKDVIMVAVLRGAVMFMADLARAVDFPIEIDFMVVSSYGSQAKSSGVVRITKDLASDIKGRHVIIAEDIVDTGVTLKYLQKNLMSRGPESVEIAAMFEKTGAQTKKVECRYPGLPVPDAFVVGYGLDYAERYRNLRFLGVLKPEVYGG